MSKRTLILTIALLLGTGLCFAANPDSFEISCTVAVNYAVTITTPSGGLSFSNVDVNTTYVNTSSAAIQNTGSVSADYTIKGTNLDEWTLAAAPGSNAVRLLGTMMNGAAGSGDFDVATDTIAASEANMDATNYTNGQTGDDVSTSAYRELWIRLDSPTDTTYDTQQDFRIDVKAYPASTF